MMILFPLLLAGNGMKESFLPVCGKLSGVLTPMVEIKLDRQDTQCLFEHAEKHSVAWTTLKTSLDVWITQGDPNSSVSIHSTQKAARDLLDIAQHHCVNALRAIELGIVDAQS